MATDNEELSLRDSLESSFEEHTEPESPAQPVRPAAETPASESDTAREYEERTSEYTRARDPHGRFAKKPDAAQPAAVDTATQAQEGQQPATLTPQADPYGKAPQSWKPGAREAWQTIPPPIREEIHRREREVERASQEHAQARSVSTYVQRLQQQFGPALQAEGVDALTASANLMQLASRLRFGTPVEKAQLAAHIVRNYGVDVTQLAAALDGAEAQQQPQQQAMQYRDPRVDQLFSQLQQAQQERAQAVQSQAHSSVEQFGQGKDFFEDVRADMGDIMELASQRGVDMTLEQAYERACLMNPEIAKIVAARAAAGNAGNGKPSIQRARIAASSVRGTPSAVSTPPPKDLRGAIEAAIEQVGER